MFGFLGNVKNSAGALALVVALAAGGTLLSGKLLRDIQASDVYRQSQVISSVFSQEDVGVTKILTDPKAGRTLLKFTGALADAYLHFELIPLGEEKTFSVVYGSLGPGVEVDSFAYRGRNLTITGNAQSKAQYHAFLEKIRGQRHFAQVRGSVHAVSKGEVSFSVECLSAPYSQKPEIT